MSLSKEKNTLLCWHSARHGSDVLFQAIKSLKSRKIIVNQVIYLIQEQSNVPADVKDIEFEVIKASIKDPSSHKEIYDFVSSNVIPAVQGFSNLHINVSPGTPAMHSVWLIFHAGGRFPFDTKIWSSQFNPQTKRNSISEVEFPITTYLSEINKLIKSNPQVALYRPDSQSLKRREALEELKRYANVPNAPLLILGERGLGKTRLVETFISQVKGKDVVALPCGGLDSTIAESMLFGHRKGAFTGAENQRSGLLKSADKNILFLDEVQDLPVDIQRKLVRILQDDKHLFRPMGSDSEESSEFELVCASNLSIAKLRDKLDHDFYDRISHFQVEIPPLRECRDDLTEDWANVWNEMRRDSNIPETAPWNFTLKQALNSNSLSGNLRSLQKLALLMMAWFDLGEINATQKAISLWEKGQIDSDLPAKQYFGEGTRDERILWFKQKLATWAKETFGTWKNAATELSCDPKTLRDDVKLNN